MSTTLTSTERPPAADTSRWLSTKRIAFLGTAALLLIGGGYAITGAVFTDSETVPGNSVGTASLTIGETVAAPVAVADLSPGDTVETEDVLVFENTGTVPFTYTVALEDVVTSDGSPAALAGWLPVTISAGGQTASGTLDDLPEITVASLAPEATAGVDVTVGLDIAADNSAQSRTATFDLVITAEQIVD